MTNKMDKSAFYQHSSVHTRGFASKAASAKGVRSLCPPSQCTYAGKLYSVDLVLVLISLIERVRLKEGFEWVEDEHAVQ